MNQLNQFVQWLLSPGIILTLALSVFFSYKSRRNKDTRKKGVNAAKMNISMGSMLLFIAAVQMFLAGSSTLRIVIGSIFLVIGIFNIFAGLRNLSAYRASEHSEALRAKDEHQ